MATRTDSRDATQRMFAGALLWLAAVGCTPMGEVIEPPLELEGETLALAGENQAGLNLSGANLSGSNLAGTNLGGPNLGGVNLAGNNLAGNNLAGTNLAGNNLAGNNLAATNLAATNLAGTNLAGNNLAATNLAGSYLSGSNVAGTNLAGNNLAGTNLAATNLAGNNSGANIHKLTVPMNGMLYSGEDIWSNKTGRCVVMGIGSTAFPKLLGQNSANARMYMALGKLRWGFARSAGGSMALQAWEAVVWGDRSYCVFVLATPTNASWTGVAGFLKAIFRWAAPPSQTVEIAGIEASAPYDSSLKTSVISYTGMMNAGAHHRAGKISDRNYVAGLLAFATATTNNRSVLVDFSSWVLDSSKLGLVLGNVQSSGPPTYAESVYYALDNGDGSVRVMVKSTIEVGESAQGLKDSYYELAGAWLSYIRGTRSKPVPRRCGGSLWSFTFQLEPVPGGRCDSGLKWPEEGGLARGYRYWSTVSGTTSPMNRYMKLPQSATVRFERGEYGNDFRTVLSETYVHMWEKNFD